MLVSAAGETVHAWSAALEPLWALEVDYACSVAFSPDGTIMALGSWEQGRIGRV